MLKSNIFLLKKNQKRKDIYLDYSASVFPNPSSIHKKGIIAGAKLKNARIKIASYLNARPHEIIFTSGGTESNNLAIQGIVIGYKSHNSHKSDLWLAISPTYGLKFLPHIITTNIEHPSVLETCKMLEKRGFAEISIIPVETNGIVDIKKIKKEIRRNTVLISVNYANNEIGTIQPIREIAKEIRFYKKKEKRDNIFFHTDAVQASNYLDMNVEKLGVDLLSLSGSKIENAGRIGILYKKNRVYLAPILKGGDQEFGLRPGTENLEGIIKFANALEILQKIKNKENVRLTKLRDYFIKKLTKMSKMPFDINEKGIIINGDLEKRLPNNINITIPKIPSDLLVIELSAYGIMVSSKSACKSGSKNASYVIEAINPKLDKEIGGLRFSLGFDTTKQDIDYTIASLNKIINKLKKWY